MTVKQQIEYWIKTARGDLETAQLIFDSGRNLHHCLFFCHLALEKGLKANVVKKTKATPPKIHDLEILAEKAGLDLPDDMKDFFSLMNTFNLEGIS
jgi:HEPN domain-containing protein